jgi:uncharacterized damage-inducible protein DinB
MSNSTNRRKFLTGVAAGAAGLAATGTSTLIAAATPSRAEVFLGTFGRAAELNLKFAEKMPAEHYSFRPVPEIRSYAEQALHIASTNVFFTSSYLVGMDPPEINFEPEEPTKEQVIALMKQSDEYVKNHISGLSDEAMAEEVETFAGVLSREGVCWFMRDHMTHTRGQMVIYLRLKGFVPPQYVGF